MIFSARFPSALTLLLFAFLCRSSCRPAAMAQSPSDGFLDAVKAGDTDTVRAMMHLPPSDPAAKPIVVPHAARTDPNTCDSDGSCALHWAAWVRARGAFVALLEAGADPSHCNARQESVLEWALRGGDLFILAQLLTIPLSPSPAVPQTLRLDSRNAFGGQAIHIAAEEGSTELLAALVLRGADINARDKRGKTPLMCAAHRNQPGVSGQRRIDSAAAALGTDRCALTDIDVLFCSLFLLLLGRSVSVS